MTSAADPLLSFRTCPIYESWPPSVDSIPVRQLAFTVRGVPCNTSDATVIIFLPGGGMGRDTVGFESLQVQQSWLEEQSITLITVDRAGYGGSLWTEYQPYESRMKTDASDLYTLVRYLSLSRCYFLGHSGGCPALLAYAAHPEYSSTVIRMALACSPTPLCDTLHYSSPSERSVKRKVQKFLMVNSWSRQYIIVPAMRKLIKRWVLKPDEMLQFTEREMSAPKDREWYNQAKETKRITFIKAVTSAMQHSDTNFEIGADQDQERQASLLSNILDILISDIVESIHLFPDFSTITCPIDVWYGDQDVAAPHGAWLASQLHSSRPMRCEGHGHQLVFSLFPNILTTLINKG